MERVRFNQNFAHPSVQVDRTQRSLKFNQQSDDIYTAFMEDILKIGKIYSLKFKLLKG